METGNKPISHPPGLSRTPGWIRLLLALCIGFSLLRSLPLGGEEERRGKGSLFNALQDRAYLLVQKGEIRASIPYFRKMVQLQPYNERLLYNYALSLLYQEKVENRIDYEADCRTAVGFLQKSIRLREQTGERNRFLALRYFHLGMGLWFLHRPDEAERSFAKSDSLDPGDGEALFNRIAILEDLGRIREMVPLEGRYRNLQSKKEKPQATSDQK